MGKVLQFRKSDWYQLKITLQDIRPPIWRRVVMDSNTMLLDLHKIIQTSMGWKNIHLHHFLIDGEFYVAPSQADPLEEELNYGTLRLGQVLSEEKQTILYEYDFGDGWVHKILLEKILPVYKTGYPVCLAGRRNCPPEDCGGIYGYENLLEVISDPENEDHDGMLDWLGDDFDPEYFDKEQVNKVLRYEDYGSPSFD